MNMSDKVKKLSEAYETLQKESADLEKVLKEKRDAHGKLSLENRDLEAQMTERHKKMFVLKNERDGDSLTKQTARKGRLGCPWARFTKIKSQR